MERQTQRFREGQLGLARMLVAPDDGEGRGAPMRKGVNEYSVPCFFSAPLPEGAEGQRRLVAARPVGVDARGLLVEALAGEAPPLCAPL